MISRNGVTLAALCMASVLLTGGCSLPRVIVLHDPLTADEHDRLGRLYEARGETLLAANQYREAIKKDRSHLPSFVLLGDLSYRTGQYGEAQSAYEKAILLDGRNGDLRNNLACIYLLSGRNLDQAEGLATEALSLNRDRRGFYLDTLGLVLLKQGKVKRAVTALRRAAAALTKADPELQLEVQSHLAEAYKTAGDRTSFEETVRLRQELQKNIGPFPAHICPVKGSKSTVSRRGPGGIASQDGDADQGIQPILKLHEAGKGVTEW